MNTKLYPFTFQDTGVKINYRKVSPLLMAQVQRAMPKPPPPVVNVTYGDEVRAEPNPDDPDYQKEVEAWQGRLLYATQKTLIERGVVVELTDEDKQAVADLRDFHRETAGVELEGSDKMVYVLYLAVGSKDDLQELIDAISNRSYPTEGAIADAEAAFPG